MALIKGKQLADGAVTATKSDTTNGTISTINAGDSAVEGSGEGLARRDHQHAVSTAAAGSIAVGDSAAEGASSSLARADHTHALAAPSAPANVTKEAASAGASSNVARADHKHDVSTAAAVELAETNTEGTATTLARSDHTHSHGNRSGGTLHAVATQSTAGFMSATDKVKLDSAQSLSEIDAKESCLVKAQGNLTLSGEQTIDGVLTSTSRVLVDQQTTPAEDGIYVTGAGAWTRATDAPVDAEARGWRVWIEQGTVDGSRLYACSNVAGSDVVGTDGLTFALIGAGSPRGAGDGLVLNGNNLEVANADGSITPSAGDLKVGVLATDAQHGTRGGGTQHSAVVSEGASGFMTGADKKKLDDIETAAQVNDTPRQESLTTQAITGTDTALTDTLTNTPIVSAESLQLYLNGVLQTQGAGADYTVVAATGTITWLASSGTAVDLEVTDKLDAIYLS